MIDCICVDTMRRSDEYTIDNFVPSLQLMHRAAYGVFLAHRWKSPVAIVVGSGNNGGDGYALACIMKEYGIACSVFTVSKKQSPDSAYYAEKSKKAGILISPFDQGCLQEAATIVDCLLGTGFQGSIRDNYRSAIEEINASDAYVVSVDINSGMNGDTGNCEIAVKSDLTVTIGFVKNGLITPNAGRFMKRLVCTDIGITLIKQENHICTAEEWQKKCGLPGFYSCPDWLDMEPIRSLD